MEKFRELLRKSPVEYRIIQVRDTRWTILVHAEEKNMFEEFLIKHIYAKVQHDISEENGYEFRYQLDAPILYEYNGKYVEIYTKLPCASLTEKVFIPLDGEIQKAAWNKFDLKQGIYGLAPEILYIYLLTVCIFRKREFIKSDILYFDNNKSLLGDSYTRGLLQKVFFGFTDRLIVLLKERKYQFVFQEYISYKEY